MNVLIIGGGGREHVLAWKIAQSPIVEKVFCAPGNPGVANVGTCVDLDVDDFDAVASFAKDNGVGLAVIGPEAPLAAGIVDALEVSGVVTFGPTKAAAQLEASKSFAKDLMARYNIPTAKYGEFSDPESAKAYIRAEGAPIVVKADGLAAGKGVTVARTIEEAEAAVDAAMVNMSFGDAGARVIIEECMVGEEASILAFTDGRTVLPLATSQDHKPAFNGDEGPNTGGMGAYSPAPVVDEAMMDTIRATVLEPCVNGMAEDGIVYKGILYAGLMITDEGPKVVEFNCRFGDPEAQVVLPRLQSDVVPIMLACREGVLSNLTLDYDDRACVTVVMASPGYPGSYPKGIAISGIESAEETGAIVFHAGTASNDGSLVTSGGRVLSVTALGDSIPKAIQNAYQAVNQIHFDGAHYRTDIGKKALSRI